MLKLLSYQIEREKVVGSLHKTRSNKCVIITHGLARNRSERLYVEFAKELERNNINAFRFDFRGFGESEGKSEKFSHFTECKDIKDTISYLNRKFQMEKFGVVGHSHTGIVALMATALDERINAVVCWNGAFRPQKAWSSKEIKLITTKGYLYYKGVKIGIPLYESAKRIRPEEYAKKVRVPVLLLHGVKDESVPLEESEFIYSKLAGKKKLIKVKGGDHFFTLPEVRKKVFALSLKWFKKYL